MREQIVEVHHAAGALAFRITPPHLLDLRRPRAEIDVLFFEDLRDRFLRVDGERKDVHQHVGLWKARVFEVDFRLVQAGRDQVPRVFAVEDSEIPRVAEQVRVPAQYPIADRVKRAAPERGNIAAEQIRHPPHHLFGGLVCEGQQQDAVHRNALLQQKRDAIGESAGFPCAGAGDDQGRAGPGRDGIVLLWIQFARVVNPEVDWRTELWQPVVTRHSTIQNGKGKTKKQKEHRLRRRAHLDTATGARAVPARSTSLGRGGLANSRVFTPAKPLRTGTVRGPAVAVSRCARG